MQIIKETREVEKAVMSEDGRIYRNLSGLSEEERKSAYHDVAEYESTAKGVLFQQLVKKGVLSAIKIIKPVSDSQPLTEEEERSNNMCIMLDCIMDDDMGRSDYFLFTPADEQDIKDLICYTKLEYDCGVYGKECEYYRTTGNIEVGKTYIFQINGDCEWCSFVSPQKLSERVKKMCDFYETLGKAQKKSK